MKMKQHGRIFSMKKKLYLRLLKNVIFVFIVSFPFVRVEAQKLDLMFGYYDIEARSGNSEGNLSNFGIYRFGYFTPLVHKVEIGFSYSLSFADGFTGDIAYGPDFLINYFFLTPISSQTLQVGTQKILIKPCCRPFIALGFHQRQFQSIKSQYAGFGLSLGSEYSLRSSWVGVINRLKSELRYINFVGADGGSASELSVLFGFVF